MTISTHLYESASVIIPLADIQHIENHSKAEYPGLMVIMKSTRWNYDQGNWENNLWVQGDEIEQFMQAFRSYVLWKKVNS